MSNIIKNSFTANADTDANMLNLLINVAGFKDRSEFATYMGVETADLSETPTWATKYLSDIIDANLTHLGYVMKDTKQEGMLGEYKEVVFTFENKGVDNPTPQPIVINQDKIITEQGTLKISLLVNITNSIKEKL